ncbi:AAA family ATPase [Streptomyces sp. NPDC018031]|uniref:AAA family ATPase n=1 Tax=Streptomyces sp. NPDC018031 TaxID=3365033 RepID=UPI0037A16501
MAVRLEARARTTLTCTVPLTRRDIETAARRQLARNGGVVVRGPGGSGKTWILRAVVAWARERGETVLVAGPGPAERTVPFSSLADLLDAVPAPDFAPLPAPQRAALLAAVRREPVPPHSAGPDRLDPLALRLGALGLLRRLADRGPVLLAVDDAQHIDNPSADILRYAARRLTGHALRAVVIESTGSTGSTESTESTESTGTPRAVVPGSALCPGEPLLLDLPPADLAELRELVDGRTRRRTPGWLLRAVHQACAGNLRDALEITGLLDHCAAHPDRDAPLPVPGRVRDALAARLHGADPAVRDLLVLAACAPRPTVRLLCGTPGTPPGGSAPHAPSGEPRFPGQLPPHCPPAPGRPATTVVHALLTALHSGVLVVDDDGDRLRFAEPLFAAASYAAASPACRRWAHARLAETLPETGHRARHQPLASPWPDEELAAALAAAARLAAFFVRLDRYEDEGAAPAGTDAPVSAREAAAQAPRLVGAPIAVYSLSPDFVRGRSPAGTPVARLAYVATEARSATGRTATVQTEQDPHTRKWEVTTVLSGIDEIAYSRQAAGTKVFHRAADRCLVQGRRRPGAAAQRHRAPLGRRAGDHHRRLPETGPRPVRRQAARLRLPALREARRVLARRTGDRVRYLRRHRLAGGPHSARRRCRRPARRRGRHPPDTPQERDRGLIRGAGRAAPTGAGPPCPGRL